MSLGLSMIVKDEVEELQRILKDLDPYIDRAYVTVTSEARLKEFEAIDNDKLEISTYKWIDNFASARNFNKTRIKTDYYIWLDSDDSVINPELLPRVVQAMEQQNLDCVFVPYEYMFNEQGECIAWHVRERVVRTSHPFKWEGAIHETLISTGMPNTSKEEDLVIRHNKKVEDIAGSAERNHKILLKEYNKLKDKRDPRVIHYLGISYFMQRDYKKAIETLLEYIQVSGWDEEIYRSWNKIAEAHILLGNLAKANAAVNAAIDLLPDYPEAYYVKVQIAHLQKKPKSVLEWLKVAVTKKQPPTTQVLDPSMKARALLLGVFAYTEEGDPKEAFVTLQDVLEISPNNKEARDIYPIVEYSYLEAKALESIEWLSQFYSEHQGDVVKLLQSLPSNLFSDPRLNAIRQKFIPSVTWPYKSVVIFCGPSNEVWGADTLGNGMGGSEEAIVYLSRELAKLGWQVTVYNERDEEYVDDIGHDDDPLEWWCSVTYKPWTLFNYNDRFDVFVAWRAPEHVATVKARKVLVDLHDAVPEKRVMAVSDLVDKFMTKSNYHRKLYKNVKNAKFAVISNGIKGDQFK
jgi:tetratricopeptide (TPR) repeat protein